MIKKEISIFLFVGILAVIIDFLIYQLFGSFMLLNTDLAKGIGFCSGTVFAYFANRYWTFNHSDPLDGSVWRFILLYGTTLVTNVIVNSLALQFLISQKTWVNHEISIKFAFVIATGVSAIINFFGLKLFVFKSKAN